LLIIQIYYLILPTISQVWKSKSEIAIPFTFSRK